MNRKIVIRVEGEYAEIFESGSSVASVEFFPSSCQSRVICFRDPSRVTSVTSYQFRTFESAAGFAFELLELLDGE